MKTPAAQMAMPIPSRSQRTSAYMAAPERVRPEIATTL